MLKLIGHATVVFIVAFFWVHLSKVNAFTLPSEQDIQGIKTLCGAGNVDSVSVTTKVDAAIESWRKVSAGANAEAAKKNLAAALGQVTHDEQLSGIYKIYVDCIENQVQQFLAPPASSAGSVKITTSGPGSGVINNVNGPVNYTVDQSSRIYQPDTPRSTSEAPASVGIHQEGSTIESPPITGNGNTVNFGSPPVSSDTSSN